MPWGRPAWGGVSNTAQGGRSGPRGSPRPLEQVPDVQAAPHGIGDALLEAEPHVAPAHCSAHALLGCVSLRGLVPCTRGCCSLDNDATEEVPLRLKETGWSGSRGLSSSRLALPGERAQRPWPPRHAPSTTLTLTSSLPRSGGASTLPRWEPGPGRAIMLSSRELDSGT